MLPQGGLIAAVHGRRRRRRASLSDDDEDFSALLEPPQIFKDRMDAVDSVLEDLESQSMFGPSKPQPKQAEISAIEGLLEKVENKIGRSDSYFKLGGTATFFILFAILLFTQRNVSDSYDMESSIVNLIVGQLPTLGTGGYTNSGVGAAGSISSSNDFYTWLSSGVIANVFSDPVCGDGSCDAPDEYAGFGRFGCPSDCGNYLNVTEITINLENVIQTSSDSLGWDVSGITRISSSEKAGFKYNIYSETMGDFLFATDQAASTVSVTTNVPDGVLTLVMYQTQKTSDLVDGSTIHNFYPFVLSTIPERNTVSDYQYGDQREYLSSSFLILQGIENYCYSSGPAMPPECQSLDSFDMFVQLLSSYGLNGSITMKSATSNKNYDTLASVQFCSVMPNTTGGSAASQNKAYFQSAKTTCQSGRRRSQANVPKSSDTEAVIRGEIKEKKAIQEESSIDHRAKLLHADERKSTDSKGRHVQVASTFREEPQTGAPRASHRSLLQSGPPIPWPLQTPTCTDTSDGLPLIYVEPAQTTQICLKVTTGGSNTLYILTSFQNKVQNYDPRNLKPESGGFYISRNNITAITPNFELVVQSGQQGPAPFDYISSPYPMTIPSSWSAFYLYISVLTTDTLCLSFVESDCTLPDAPRIVVSFSLPVTVTNSYVGQSVNSKTVLSISVLPATNGSSVSFSTQGFDSLSCSNATSSGSLFFYDDSAPPYLGSTLTVYAIACKKGLKTEAPPRSWTIFPSPFVAVTVKVEQLTSSTFSDTYVGYLKAAIAQVAACNTLQVLYLSATTDTSNVTNYTTAYLSLKILADSNVNVVAYNGSVVSKINTISSVFRSLADINATLSISSSSITSQLSFSNEFDNCDTHYDCKSGLFCSKENICLPCASCVVDFSDAYNGFCPQDLCPNSGGYPRCVDASTFLAPLATSCSDHHAFSVWKYGTMAEGSPQVIPSFTPKVRELTPYNRLVGAVVVTQTRMKRGSCLNNMQGADVKLFTASAGTGINCPLSNQLDSEPFGYDPTFMTFSSNYNGKLRPEVFYGNGERYNTSSTAGAGYGYPKGFFPQKYDQNALDTNLDGMLSPEEVAAGGTTSYFEKPSKYIDSSEQNTFKLYFDERLTYKQALKMVQFAKDGKYIDSQTKEIKVEIVTYNAVKNIFMYSNFIFSWEAGGKIPWDYQIQTISVDKILYPSALQIGLMVLIVIFLVFNCAYEFRDILVQARKFALHDYLSDPFNWIDLVHFFFMWGSVVSWFMYRQSTLTFKLSPNYPILFYGPEYSAVNSSRRSLPFEAPISATNFAKARMFRTNNAAEFEFLQLINSMREISSRMEMYSFFSGVAVVFFVMRMLKSLDFQERMGMVTRTIAKAASDLWHFVLLFIIVFLGYAIVGVLLFGHQFEGMHDLSHSCITLTIFLLSLDATQFYSSMSHAATPLAFYIFLWSYIFIVFFILFNIFLAILVDAYATVKEATDGSTGLLEELAGVTWHAVRRSLPLGSRFLSDEHFARILKEERRRLGQGQRIQSEVNRKLEDKKEILLRGGIRVDLSNLQHIIQPAKMEGGHQVSPEETPDAKVVAAAAAEAFADDMVIDVMERYGSNVLEHRERRNHEFKELVGIENMRRLLVMNLLQINVLDEQKRIADVLESMAIKTFGSVPEHKRSLLKPSPNAARRLGELHVTIVSASGLPRMDLIRSCDPYCVLYIDGHGDQPTHTTATIPKTTTPHWNEKCVWDLYSDSRMVTISVWDRDNVTKDDLIGTVLVDLRDLEPNSFGKQLDLRVTNARRAKRLRNAKLQVIFQRQKEGEALDPIQEEGGDLVEPINGSAKDEYGGIVTPATNGVVYENAGAGEGAGDISTDLDKLTDDILNLSDM